MTDIFDLIQTCATKEDRNLIKSQIDKAKKESDEKIAVVNQRIDTVESPASVYANKIESLEINIEILKQDQLKNNICISGIPQSKIESENGTGNIVIAIAKALNTTITHTHFSSYTAAHIFIIWTAASRWLVNELDWFKTC